MQVKIEDIIAEMQRRFPLELEVATLTVVQRDLETELAAAYAPEDEKAHDE